MSDILDGWSHQESNYNIYCINSDNNIIWQVKEEGSKPFLQKLTDRFDRPLQIQWQNLTNDLLVCLENNKKFKIIRKFSLYTMLGKISSYVSC